MSDALITVIGLKDFPDTKEVNVRMGPTRTSDNPFKMAVGTASLPILDVQPDSAGEKDAAGKLYQWFLLQFPNGSTGWIRDDLLGLLGDAAKWGYGVVTSLTRASELTRTATTSATPSTAATIVTATPIAPVTITQPAPIRSTEQEIERVRKAAFAITARFEGSGYAAYNNYDAGIVSYGIFQFTLAASSLQSVLELYLAASQSDTATKLRGYMPRVQGKDTALRQDMSFKDLLKAAANEPAMQEAQLKIGTEKYWNAVWNGYIAPRNLQTPLGWALLFDMGINFGTGHGFVRLAEEQLGVPPRSQPGTNGITEQQLITKVAELRKQSHDKQAIRDNLPGLRVRGDFWVGLCNNGDWGLQGDSTGNLNVKGTIIQVRNP